MKKLFTIVIVLLVTSLAKSQCTPPATFAVGPYTLPCGYTTVISAGTNSTTGTYSYSWSGPPLGGMSCPGGVSCYNNSINAAGVYTVVIYDYVNGCSSINTMTVIQGSLYVSVSGNDSICSGSTAFISASAFPSPISYTWSTGSNFSGISVTPSVTTIYNVSATNTNYGCSGSNTFTVNVSACVGIEELELSKNILIGPNPNSGKFNVVINSKIENAEIRIVNEIGQEVFKQTIKQGNSEINIETLAKGIYHYSINESKKPLSRGKIVIE